MDLLPSETAVGRVALRVADPGGIVGYYTDVVGLDIRHRDDDRTVLGAGGTALLELHHAPDAPARGRTDAGLFHTALRVPSRSALGAALARIEDGWQLAGASDHRVSEALYLRDPEGNGVEVYCDRPRTEWPTRDGRVEMDTLALDLNSLREVAGDPGTGVPVGTDVGHVHLEVTDLRAARAFYVDTLGLDTRQEWDRALFVAAGGYHHHVGLNTWNGRSTPAGGQGIAWFELQIPAESFPAVVGRIDDAGVGVEETTRGVAVTDPDGIGVRLRRA
jgi:catechol 2,3-dioxygenase